MRKQYVYEFSLLEPVAPDVAISTFPRSQIDRLFTKKTHHLDWMRYFWLGAMVKLARTGAMNTPGRYRITMHYTGFGNYKCELQQFI